MPRQGDRQPHDVFKGLKFRANLKQSVKVAIPASHGLHRRREDAIAVAA